MTDFTSLIAACAGGNCVNDLGFLHADLTDQLLWCAGCPAIEPCRALGLADLAHMPAAERRHADTVYGGMLPRDLIPLIGKRTLAQPPKGCGHGSPGTPATSSPSSGPTNGGDA